VESGQRGTSPVSRYLGAIFLVFLGCGDGPSKTVGPSATKAQSGTYLEKISTGRPNLDKYQRAQNTKATLITLSQAKKRAAPTVNQPSKSKLKMNVTITSSGVASGGTAVDWEGLKPRERFFKVAYVEPNADPAKLGSTHYFRIKTNKPKEVVRLLGQLVQIEGTWVTRSIRRAAQASGSQLPKTVDLRPRRGQDLVEAVKKARREFVDRAVDGKKAPQENDLPAMFERQGIMRATQEALPLFHAETVTPLKSRSGLRPSRRLKRANP
jgi:hypothetical protein